MNSARCLHWKDLQLKGPLERVVIMGPPLMLGSPVGPALGSAPGRTAPWLLSLPTGGCRTRCCRAEGPGYGEPGATRAGLLFPLVGSARPVTLGHSR